MAVFAIETRGLAALIATFAGTLAAGKKFIRVIKFVDVRPCRVSFCRSLDKSQDCRPCVRSSSLLVYKRDNSPGFRWNHSSRDLFTRFSSIDVTMKATSSKRNLSFSRFCFLSRFRNYRRYFIHHSSVLHLNIVVHLFHKHGPNSIADASDGSSRSWRTN